MDHIQKTVDELISKVADKEKEVLDLKRLVNLLLQQYSREPHYTIAEPDKAEPVVQRGSWRNDQFYGQPLSGVVKTILQARKAAGGGAMPVNDIYAMMTTHGYDFACSNDENAKNVLRSSLRKNSAMFHRLPTGEYGLKEWYPHVKNRTRPTENTTIGKEAGAADEEGFDFDEKEHEDLKQASKQNTAPSAA